MINLPSLEDMLKAGMHFGHRTFKWYPKMAPYIFAKRNGVHIIDLRKSRENLGAAIEFMAKMIFDNKTILFVGSKTQVKKQMEKTAKAVNMPYVTGKWLAGIVTNFAVIKKAINKYSKLVDEKKLGKLGKYTKKERLDFDREIKRLGFKVGGLVSLKRLPDAIFVWDVKVEKNAILEAKKKNIPLIAVCDTNANPSGIKYVIPANDDATKTIKLVLSCVEKNLVEALSKKTESAASGGKEPIKEIVKE